MKLRYLIAVIAGLWSWGAAAVTVTVDGPTNVVVGQLVNYRFVNLPPATIFGFTWDAFGPDGFSQFQQGQGLFSEQYIFPEPGDYFIAASGIYFTSTGDCSSGCNFIAPNLDITASVPEPATWALMLLGFLMLRPVLRFT